MLYYSVAGGRDVARTRGAGGTRSAPLPATARSPTPTVTPGRSARPVSHTQSNSHLNYSVTHLLSHKDKVLLHGKRLSSYFRLLNFIEIDSVQMKWQLKFGCPPLKVCFWNMWIRVGTVPLFLGAQSFSLFSFQDWASVRSFSVPHVVQNWYILFEV